MPDATVLVATMFSLPADLEELLFSVISFAVLMAVLSAVFYVAGLVVVGKKRALFKDAVAISVLGTLVLIVCLTVFRLEIAGGLSLVAWLLLVRHYYETGLLGSVAVGLASVFVAVLVLLGLDMLLGYSGLLFSLEPFIWL